MVQEGQQIRARPSPPPFRAMLGPAVGVQGEGGVLLHGIGQVHHHGDHDENHWPHKPHHLEEFLDQWAAGGKTAVLLVGALC